MIHESRNLKRALLLFALLAFWVSALVPALADEGEQVLDRKTIMEAARSYLLNNMDWDPSDVEVTVDYTGQEVILPQGQVSMEFKLTGNRHPLGHTLLSLVVRVDGELKRKMWLNANVDVFFAVVQASRTVPRDRILDPGDIEIVRVRSSRPLHNIIYDPEEVIGKRAVRDIDTGQTLSPFMLKQVPVVQRGDRVLLVAESGRIRITAPGLVRETGFRGSMIQVENLQTKKNVYGTVIDAKTIKVEF